jgi:hypothetical protein
MHHFFPKSELGNFGVFLDQMRDKPRPSRQNNKTKQQNNKTTKQNNEAKQQSNTEKCDSATVPQCQPTLRSIA